MTSTIPKTIVVNFEVCARTFTNVLIRPSFRPPTKGFTDQFRDFMKNWRGCTYDEEQKTGAFPLEHFQARRQLLQTDLGNRYRTTVIEIGDFSSTVLDILRKSPEQQDRENQERERIDQCMKTYLSEHMNRVLSPYQRKAVVYAAMRRFRCLIADDMGLGKTLESIACFAYSLGADRQLGIEQKPLLVICPSSLRIQWGVELCRWMPETFSSPETDILVVLKGTDYEKKRTGNEKVVIISYDLAAKLDNHLKLHGFGMAIVDESHMLKNSDSMRTKRLDPVLRGISRVILLSGTPALARPKELYSQLSILKSSLFPRFHAYGVRYCAGHELPFQIRSKYGGFARKPWDYSGSSNLAELNLILREHIMIRRQKEDVLGELPDKIRECVYVQVPMSKAVQKKMLQAREKVDEQMAWMEANPDKELSDRPRDKSVLEMYQLMATLKSDVVCKYLQEFFESNEDDTMKVLVFAHHKAMLDALEETCETKIKLPYMRIDGSISAVKRAENVDRFQNDPACRIALLSITAAGVGLTLTKANVEIFAELHWTPGVLSQAESRAHRRGQERKVVVQYLVGKDTMEVDMWNMLEQKIDVVSSMLDHTSAHKRTGMEAQLIDVGQKRLKPITD